MATMALIGAVELFQRSRTDIPRGFESCIRGVCEYAARGEGGVDRPLTDGMRSSTTAVENCTMRDQGEEQS